MAFPVVRLQFQDALRTSMGARMPAPYQCVVLIRLAEPEFSEEDKEAFFRNFYGENWKLGNEDGSRYEVSEFEEQILTSEGEILETKQSLEAGLGSKFKTWFYLKDGDGSFSSATWEELFPDK